MNDEESQISNKKTRNKLCSLKMMIDYKIKNLRLELFVL